MGIEKNAIAVNDDDLEKVCGGVCCDTSAPGIPQLENVACGATAAPDAPVMTVMTDNTDLLLGELRSSATKKPVAYGSRGIHVWH